MNSFDDFLISDHLWRTRSV
ncbi:hypothetical protein E2R68_07735 [Psychromonas sp. RZ22]|nr:hypothetical protein E2R68_07735 [Psychromonas sp. RZ22]